MNKSKILKNTESYHDELIESLKKPKEADMYLRLAMEEYHEDGNTEALLVALRNIAEARGGMSKLAKKTHLNRQNLCGWREYFPARNLAHARSSHPLSPTMGPSLVFRGVLAMAMPCLDAK